MLDVPRRALLLLATGTALVAASLAPAISQTSEPAGRRVALSGYDPVSYFTEGRPQKGSSAFWFAFDDVVYHFRSLEHRSLFASDPERYAPQYAGLCASGMSKGLKSEPDPEAWHIENGKLFVLKRREALQNFTQNTAALVKKADANWHRMRHAPESPR
jgi:hypothetical protein